MIGNIISWLMSHQVVLGAFLIAILDFVFALNSKWESNGVLHSIYVFLKGMGKPSGNN